MDLWAVTVSARRSLLATFERLDDDQWAVPSLCDGWTVHHVLAHVILAARPSLRRYSSAMVRARGDFDRANSALTQEEAKRPVDELLASYREVLEHRFAPPGWPAAAPLSDILLHTLDVRIPLGIETEEAPEHYEPVMGLLLGRFRRPFTRAGRPTVRWTSVDTAWTSGSGPEVSGTMADLALTAAGRSARLEHLEGEGVDAVRSWLV